MPIGDSEPVSVLTNVRTTTTETFFTRIERESGWIMKIFHIV